MSEAKKLDDKVELGQGAKKFAMIGGGAGLALIILSAVAGLGGEDRGKQFFHSYLLSFMFFLTVALGALFFVTLQNLTKAGWSVAVRRIAELFAATIPVFALLALVIVIPMLGEHGNHTLYEWVAHNPDDHLLHLKEPYLNVPFFVARLVLYFAVWAFFAWFYLGNSTKQDQNGDFTLTRRSEKWSGPGMVLFALTLTFASFDLLMSLDYHWFSTIFGVYIFAGSMSGGLCTIVLTSRWLQKRGFVKEAITVEHYHDLGKLMFAFVFFWGYIAFSQYMLIWYANLPEETGWLLVRQTGEWVGVSIFLIFGNFVIPFLGLLSRHVKRNNAALAFWAVYLLVIHWVDLYWLVMPNLSKETLPFHWMDLTTLVGIGLLLVASFAFLASKRSLVPVKDPRLGESLSFENV